MIIGISGKKQCGKDTICKIIQAIDSCSRTHTPTVEEIVKELERPTIANSIWQKHAFADKLKRMCSVLTDFPDITFWESAKIKDMRNPIFGMTNREILQKIGQSLRENIHPDVWVKALLSGYEVTRIPLEMSRIEPQWIIPDVRMPNEAKTIKDMGGILIRVNRNTGVIDTHISEIALDDYEGFDFIIDNNGSIEELVIKVIDVYDRIRTAGEA